MILQFINRHWNIIYCWYMFAFIYNMLMVTKYTCTLLCVTVVVISPFQHEMSLYFNVWQFLESSPTNVGFMVELHLSEAQSDPLNVCILLWHCTVTAEEPQRSLWPRLCVCVARGSHKQWRRSQRQAEDRTIS